MQERLLSPSYIFDVLVNFLVYCVHFALMLWSTGYAIKSWDSSISTAGLASGIFIVGALCARIPAGRFIDFIGRKKTFVLGTSVFFVMSLLYGCMPNVAAFMVIRFIHGAAFGTISTASSTIVAALVPMSRMGTGIGYFTLGVTMASAVGPFLSLQLTGAGEYPLMLQICQGTTLLIFILSLLIKSPERSIMPWEKQQLTSMAPGNFFSYKSLAISFIALIAGVCYSTVLSFLGAYTSSLGLTGIGSSLFFICFAATSFISRPLTGYFLDKKGGDIVIYPALLALIAAMTAIAAARTDLMLLLGALLLGYGYGTTTAACHALAVHCSPQHMIGVATSTYFVLLDFGIGVGPYTLGSLVPMYGFSVVYVVAGAVSLLGVGLYYFLMGKEGRFARLQMDRVVQAKKLIAQRRERFLERQRDLLAAEESVADHLAQYDGCTWEELAPEVQQRIEQQTLLLLSHGIDMKDVEKKIIAKYGVCVPLGDLR